MCASHARALDSGNNVTLPSTSPLGGEAKITVRTSDGSHPGALQPAGRIGRLRRHTGRHHGLRALRILMDSGPTVFVLCVNCASDSGYHELSRTLLGLVQVGFFPLGFPT